MRSASLFFTIAAAVLLSSCSATPLIQGQGKYIIKLKPKANQNSFLGLVNEANHDQLVPANKVNYRYSPKIFNGMAGEFSNAFIAQAAKNPDVEYIEADGTMHALASQANPPSWGLTRIGQRAALNGGSGGDYKYPDVAGAGVDVFVVDTGIQANHADFQGRASYDKSFVNGETTDGNGHGTHCAGTVASLTYGVAKKVKVHGVQVLSKQGSGTNSGVIGGIDYVCKNAKKDQDGNIKTVLSMSLGGSASQAIDDAVKACTDAGVVVVVAAGNENQDACKVSPARAPSAITVGSTTSADDRSSFSNWGSCVDIYAPGSDIKSLWIGADGATKTISGTSMACPHVAGVAALFLSSGGYKTVDALRNDLVKASTKLTKVTPKGGEKECRIAYAFNEASSDPPVAPGPAPAPTPSPSNPWCRIFPELC